MNRTFRGARFNIENERKLGIETTEVYVDGMHIKGDVIKDIKEGPK